LPLRPAAESDLEVLVEMQRDFYVLERVEFDRASSLKSMRTLIDEPTLGRLLVIEDGIAAVGFMAIVFSFSLEFRGRNAFLDELYVEPHARGRGLGSEALRAAEDLCFELGVKALHLEVDRWNERAKALYHRFGFFDHDRHLMTRRIPSAGHPDASPDPPSPPDK
jgi:ribosomal protein S18 acetylase RimI-like enzyme